MVRGSAAFQENLLTPRSFKRRGADDGGLGSEIIGGVYLCVSRVFPLWFSCCHVPHLSLGVMPCVRISFFMLSSFLRVMCHLPCSWQHVVAISPFSAFPVLSNISRLQFVVGVPGHATCVCAPIIPVILPGGSLSMSCIIPSPVFDGDWAANSL